MATKHVVSTLTAAEATETTKKLIDTITVPQAVKAIIGVAIQLSMAGLTTLEDVTGILEVESDDMAGWNGTQAFLIGGIGTCVTSGAIGQNPFYHQCHIPVNAGGHLKLSYTGNKAQTVNPSVRVGVVYEN